MIALVTTQSDPLLHWYELAGIIVAVPIAATAVWAMVKIVRAVVDRLAVVHEAVAGREEKRVGGVLVAEHIPSMIERFQDVTNHLAAQDAVLNTIKAELSYNGGGSTKDQVRSLTREMGKLKDGQAAAARTAAAVSAELHGR